MLLTELSDYSAVVGGIVETGIVAASLTEGVVVGSADVSEITVDVGGV